MTTYGTTREALAWLLSCQQGPRYPSSPPLEPQIQASAHRNAEDLMRLVDLVRGPRVALPHCRADLALGEHGEVVRCGRADCLECEIRAYATEHVPRDALRPKARALLKRLWRTLVDEGLLTPSRAPDVDRFAEEVEVLRYTDQHGDPAEGPSPVKRRGLRPKRVES